ncbi:MAG: alanine dehydrogenase [Deltaproteobacteria bacterium]|nr:alanine dehydrogenase [Deltaproteobacteria bacterium]
MKIGIPREIKPKEGRVALLPRHVTALAAAGHEVLVEKGAGILAGAPDDGYIQAGARVLPSARDLFDHAVMLVKVKEILPPEYGLLRSDHILFTNIHASLNREQLDRLLEVGVTAFSAENTHPFGSPNCPLAGEVGALEAIRLCLAPHGGTGRHFMGHFGEAPIKALVLGLGNVGRGALRVLLGLGAEVVALDIFEGARKAALLDWHDRNLTVDDISALPRHLPEADVLINCVLWPKERTDHLVTRPMLGKMKPGAAVVDISCDTAGAIETSRPTSWEEPVYVVDGVRHFCVDNIPGAVPVTASAGYGAAILPRVTAIADRGVVQACREDPWLARGLTCAAGELILAEAGRFQKRPFTPVEDWLARQG